MAAERDRHDQTEFLPDRVYLALVFPTSTDDVKDNGFVRLAGELRVPVVPRGRGSGLSGGAKAVEGGIIMVMTAMDRVSRDSPDGLLVVTQPGVVAADLERAVSEIDLGPTHPTPPAARRASSAAT